MSYVVAIVCDVAPGRLELEAALDAATAACARWLASERAAGRDIPCCVGCTGIQYVPDSDAPSSRVVFRTGGDLLRSGHGSCGELAALAAAILQVNEGPDAARVELQRQDARDHQAWHAVVVTRAGEVLDPTTELGDRHG